jgi:glutamate-1-semialdehyde aminotransferase
MKSKGIQLWDLAKSKIPGGTQLLSKRPEMFLPEHWPSYYQKAKGCEVWDLDGNRYIDTSIMGVGACTLGYADEDVDAAVKDAVDKGSMCTLNVPEEVELAELLLELHPWAEMVRYARTGGEAMAVAIRIARAKTGKDTVLFCGYHGWHDWYLSANLTDKKSLDEHLIPGLNPLGVPKKLSETAYPFRYNDTKGFKELLEQHEDQVGVIVMEAIRNYYPEKDFLKAIRRTTEDRGIILIVDEISSGWRMNVGGAHLLFDISLDIAVFAKGMTNGFPMAAIIGKQEVMKVAQDTFISSTYWTDKIGPVAALAAIKKFKEKKVPEHLTKIGKKVQEGWKDSASKHGIKIKVSGIYPLSHFLFDYDNHLVLKTLFTQLMLKKGFLASTDFYASYAHKEDIIDLYLEAVDETFSFISKTITARDSEQHLEGPVCHSGFKRLT